MSDQWPALPYAEWRATRDTLHMYTQVIGKLRLALSPFEPEWANVPLYVTARGLSSSPIPFGLHTLDAEFDFVDHTLVLRGGDGAIERRPLGGSVADLYGDVMRALARMGMEVAISTTPSEVPDPIPFPDDRVHDTYDPGQAGRFHRALTIVDLVLKEHHAAFRGRTTPVQFFWGTFDLALTRYSGRRVVPPADAGFIERVGGDAEEVCVGWWPGSERSPSAAFYAYGYPAPAGIEAAQVRPGGAAWAVDAGEFLLPYDAARGSDDPRRAVLDFCESTYAAAAGLMGWDPALIEVGAPRPLPRRPRGA